MTWQVDSGLPGVSVLPAPLQELACRWDRTVSSLVLPGVQPWTAAAAVGPRVLPTLCKGSPRLPRPSLWYPPPPAQQPGDRSPGSWLPTLQRAGQRWPLSAAGRIGVACECFALQTGECPMTAA